MGLSVFEKTAGSILRIHEKTPLLKKVPPKNLGIILLLIVVNCIVWAAVGVVLAYHRSLVATAVLAYTLGLRHALDADHIAAIDLMTRRLIASGRKPVAVGTFFALGHSTIVIITSIAVAATAASLSNRFDDFAKIGGIIGTAVSTAFLWILALGNAYILFRLVRRMLKIMKTPVLVPGSELEDEEKQNEDVFHLNGGGILVRCFGWAFKIVDRSWKMYPLGVLFGLGFDTSSEIALLGIASIEATKGTSIWLILIFPLLFTAGMALLDTVDGALMSALYMSASGANDEIAILYYSIVLSVVTVMVAIVIGVIQIFNLILNVAEPKGRFWDGVEKAADSYDIIGGCIVGFFVLVAVGSVLYYKRWRRMVDEKRQSLPVVIDEESDYAVASSQEDLVTRDDDMDNKQLRDPVAYTVELPNGYASRS
ncbi:NicO-domain-containing protein [Ascobolus immersus RN42]|uniref:Nickel/cobalt efflux system n=1 Tax=Ascobolus immersus RN42 TaxID=1160509 RepID=A0A3N4INA3_ASCIM|nr:NicO-domain-containing protein [Ascobolus immersus RN42]